MTQGSTEMTSASAARVSPPPLMIMMITAGLGRWAPGRRWAPGAGTPGSGHGWTRRDGVRVRVRLGPQDHQCQWHTGTVLRLMTRTQARDSDHDHDQLAA